MNVKKDNGWLAIRFWYKGERHTEYVGLRDTRVNLRTAALLAEQVKAEILVGTFNYETRFPKSRYLKKSPQKTYTLGEWATVWLEERAHKLVTETRADYASMIRKYIEPHSISNMLVSDITEGDIEKFIGELKEREVIPGRKLSPRRVNMIIARLRTMFATALRRRTIEGRAMLAEDPMKFVENIRQPKSDVDPFTIDEARALIDASDPQFSTLLTVLLFAGVRPGEALALRWEDIDWRQGCIKVRRTLSPKGEIRPPKTPGSERDVEMIEAVRRSLAEQQSRTRFSKTGLVFVSDKDGLLTLELLRDREWKRTQLKAHVRPRGIYQCRHSYAAMSLINGDTPQHVAAQLGHTTISMVVGVYGRWSRRPSDGGSMERMNKTLEDHRPRIDQFEQENAGNDEKVTVTAGSRDAS